MRDEILDNSCQPRGLAVWYTRKIPGELLLWSAPGGQGKQSYVSTTLLALQGPFHLDCLVTTTIGGCSQIAFLS